MMFLSNLTKSPFSLQKGRAFTLIELLIVVLIIAVLASIAVPNFLEFQTRAKVSRVKSDLRTIAVGLEAYRIDNDAYPEGTDNPAKYDPRFGDSLGELAPGYYTLRTRGTGGEVAGINFFTLTTPIAYVSDLFVDPFADTGTLFTYCYRPAKSTSNGYILTSFGPDHDMRMSFNGKLGAGTVNTNPLSTAMDSKSPARLGDINERAVIHYIEGDLRDPAIAALHSDVANYRGLRMALDDLSYDPTNGTVSDGDIYRLGP